MFFGSSKKSNIEPSSNPTDTAEHKSDVEETKDNDENITNNDPHLVK